MSVIHRDGVEYGQKYLPCIWPIINSLSSLSVPARSNSLPPRDSRNFFDSPTNQPSQNGFVAPKSVRHDHLSVTFDSSSRDGTDTLAEMVLRIVLDFRCHSMPEARVGKDFGLVER